MLGGEPGDGLNTEVGELVDGARGAIQSLLQRGDLGSQACDLGLSWGGDLSGLLQGLEAAFELFAEVG